MKELANTVLQRKRRKKTKSVQVDLPKSLHAKASKVLESKNIGWREFIEAQSIALVLGEL